MGFPSKTETVCLRCLGTVDKGSLVTWSRIKGQAGVYHVNCNNKEEATMPETTTSTEHEQLAALRVLLGSAHAAPINREEIAQIVQEALAEHGVTRLEIMRPDRPTVTIEQAHRLLPVIATWASRGRHLYLYGPAGSGKSTLAHQAATALGRQYGYIALCPQTPESKLLGYMDAHGQYVKTVFRERYETGGIFCIDEADNASPALLTMLNGLLENGHGAFPDAMVTRHAEFCLIATGNTCGNGATIGHGSRQAFDIAFAKRFAFLEIAYDETLERSIALSINPDAGPLVEWLVAVRSWARDTKSTCVISPRETYRLAEDLRHASSVISLEIMLNAALWNGNTAQATKALLACPLPKALVAA